LKRYQFVRAVTVDGVPYEADSVVTAAEIPTGYFESCLRVGHLVELPDQAPTPTPTPAPVVVSDSGESNKQPEKAEKAKAAKK
jgi:hypothetical protein